MELLNQHVTIRKFKKRKIQSSILESVIFSGTKASTTGNMQLYSIVISESDKEREALLPLHFNQSVAKSAPVLLTFIADVNRFTRWCFLNNASPGFNNFLSFFTAATDAILVAQNVCIAAENYGLGICYLGTTTYNAREIINVLELPKLTFPVTTVAIGYPDEVPGLTDRIPLKGVVHRGKYNGYSDDELKDIYAFKERLESSKNFVTENNKQTLAQVFTDVRYRKADNEFFSKKMIEVLKEQGFLE
ncbi:MAG TPA: nitroreductase family protein [Draconibacterium sp.]|nr:nitroreductase family protein [Draconibacterium sp.]